MNKSADDKGEKLIEIYDILYDLVIDDTDCVNCYSFYDCCDHGLECAYRENFKIDPATYDLLMKKAQEILEIATK